ncbi:hypothetical protein SRHO_G00038460 [Serrasalmus rhombeus]
MDKECKYKELCKYGERKIERLAEEPPGKSSISNKFQDPESELLKRIEDDAFFICQEMSVQNEIFYSLLLMEPERRLMVIDILQIMSSSVKDERSFMKNTKAKWNQIANKRKEQKRTAEGNQGTVCRKNIRIL